MQCALCVIGLFKLMMDSIHPILTMTQPTHSLEHPSEKSSDMLPPVLPAQQSPVIFSPSQEMNSVSLVPSAADLGASHRSVSIDTNMVCVLMLIHY
jgi:hypothetical protein